MATGVVCATVNNSMATGVVCITVNISMAMGVLCATVTISMATGVLCVSYDLLTSTKPDIKAIVKWLSGPALVLYHAKRVM